MSPTSPRRLWLFVRRTTPRDRAVFAVFVLCAAARLAQALGAAVPFATVFDVVAFTALTYFAVRSIPWVRARLLWSLRNRLIVAYVFMAVVPVVLLLTMVGVSLYLLELQIGAHLLRDDLGSEIAAMAADTKAIADALNREPGSQIATPAKPGLPPLPDPALSQPNAAALVAAAQERWPNLSAEVDKGRELVSVSNGGRFSGLVEHGGQLCIASAEVFGAANRPATLLLMAPITTAMLDGFPSKLGPIELTLLDPADQSTGTKVRVEINGTSYVFGEQVASGTRTIAPAANWFDARVNGGATLDAYRADPGADPSERPVVARFSLRTSVINRDLLTSVGALAPLLVIGLATAGVIFLLIEAAALVTGVVLTRTITHSIADLYDGTLYVRRGDFSRRVRVANRDQLGALGDSFNEMTGSISELIESQREKQKLENEVAIARDVQKRLFPHTLPSLPGLDLAAICRPARVVSGDYYDFIALDNGRVGIAIADISGKGIFASLLMASLQAALRSTATLERHAGTAEIVSRVNKHLFRNTSDDRYATLFYAVYDSVAKTLTYTNAGQLDPFFMVNGTIQELDQGGTVVGLFEDAVYTECTIAVGPGTVLVAFSDGVTEAESAYGEEFGTERLRAEVIRLRNSTATTVAENLVAAAENWSGSPEQADDITVVVARMD